MAFLLLLIIGGLFGLFGALLSLHGKRIKDIGYPQSLQEFLLLISKARHEILIATDLDPTIFNNDLILTNLSEARRRGCDIRLVFDKRADLENAPKLAKLQDKGLITIKKHEQELDVHFVVIDGQHIRLDRHPFQQFEQEGEGRVLLRTLELGRKYRHRFDEMWTQ